MGSAGIGAETRQGSGSGIGAGLGDLLFLGRGDSSAEGGGGGGAAGGGGGAFTCGALGGAVLQRPGGGWDELARSSGFMRKSSPRLLGPYLGGAGGAFGVADLLAVGARWLKTFILAPLCLVGRHLT